MKILVVDDESSAREHLRHLLAKTQIECEVSAELSNGHEAIRHCRDQPIDLVLLDTHMPGLSGLQTAQQLASLDPAPNVILMTNEHSDPMIPPNGTYERLVKPIRGEQLVEALQRTRETRAFNEEPVHESQPRRQEISALFRGGIIKVAVKDVLYMRADHKYVTVRHPGGELLVDESLRSFEQEFPDLFLRIHRNALVARACLQGLEKNPDGSTLACLDGCPERLTVSRRHLAQVRRWLREAQR